MNQLETPNPMRLRSEHIVTIAHEKPNFVRRAVSKARRTIRSFVWRRKLGAFGHGSDLVSPTLVSGPSGIAIGENVRIWADARLEAINIEPGVCRIEIGDSTVIHPRVHIGAIDSVRIGRGVLMASDVYITDHDHDCSNPDDPVISNKRVIVAPVVIGDYVWLGQRVMVLKGVRIGARSVIGAGSIVTRDVPEDSVAIGSPARVFKTFDRSTGLWKKAA